LHPLAQKRHQKTNHRRLERAHRTGDLARVRQEPHQGAVSLPPETARGVSQERVVLVWDNWPVHLHPKVLECAHEQGIELVFLPTYSPWLNPIEKLWKWLKADVLTAHRHSHTWDQLRQHVENFLDSFQNPTPHLLTYCGLLAD